MLFLDIVSLLLVKGVPDDNDGGDVNVVMTITIM